MVTMAGRKEGLGSRGGLRDSRLLVAIAAGIILGAIWASIYPHGLFSGVSTTEKVDSLTSDLEQKVAELSTRVNSLRRENDEMRDKLNIAQQEKDSAIQQLQASGGQLKPGPVGSVKSLRTNPPVAADESINPDLAKLLKKIAKNKEVLVGISNKNVAAMLKVWFTSIKQAGITNYLVIALDDEIYKFCKDHDVPAYRRDATIPKTLQGTGDNHAISGLKFHLLREFLLLGYGVLLSDVDIVYLQDPFKHLYRDCDIEAMTDGHNNATAYGYNDVFDDPKMGWSRYAHTMRIWVFNSGLFYLRPTIPAIELLDRVTTRLSNEKAWDQAVINEELFFPSRPGYEGLHASKRVMDRFLFMNSKALFVDIRKDPKYANFKPVSIHVNYHPDKYERMLGIVDYYSNGKKDALSRFPDGSE